MATKTKTLTRVILGAGGAVAVGYGVYYATHVGTVRTLEREKGDLETKVFVSQGKTRRAESRALENESLFKVLQQQTEVEQRSAAELQQQLDEARYKVQRLEEQYQQKQEEIERIHSELADVSKGIEEAKAEAKRFKEEAALADRSLRTLSAQIVQAKSQLNPLNHPLVRNMYKRDSS
eukprot:jgi/Chrzof1/1490/Cz10g09230.t1